MSNTAPPISGGESSSAITTGSARSQHDRQKSLQRRLQPGESLIPADQRNLFARSAAEQGHMPLDSMFVGKYDAGDADDLNAKVDAYLSLPGDGGSRFGVKHMPVEMLTEQARRQAEKNEAIGSLQLARQMVDDRDPASAERAFKLFPALERVPRDYLRQQVSLQLALWEMLFVGEIKGQADHDLVYAIIRDDVDIPVAPIWDPIGIAAGALSETASQLGRLDYASIFQSTTSETRPTSFFQGLFGISPNNSSLQQKTFKDNFKVALLQRLYPNLRTRPKELVLELVQQHIDRKSNYFRDGPSGTQAPTLGGFASDSRTFPFSNSGAVPDSVKFFG